MPAVRITTPIRRAAVFGAATILGLAVLSTAASAAPKAARETPTITEDTDHNDHGTPDDQPDEGDNAHPSGQDRSVERGGSGTQGKASSDPDDDGRGPERSNGGPDQADGTGGVDLADQDGNNGCGNDDDFEDDNEGWCGKPQATDDQAAGDGSPLDVPAIPVLAATTDIVVPATDVPAVVAGVNPAVEIMASTGSRPTQVLGVTLERSETASAATVRPAEVLGVSFERGSLARTGLGLTLLLTGLGLGLVALGLTLRTVATKAS